MRCSLLAGLSVFCLVLAVSIVVILLSHAYSCPLGTFRCLDSNSSSAGGVCLPRRLLCDGRRDCSSGSDENNLECTDYYGELISLDMSLKPTQQLLTTTTTAAAVEALPSYTTTLSPVYNSCAVKESDYPRGCICRNRTWLSCRNMTLSVVPQVSTTLSRIVLKDNVIRRLTSSDFKSYDLELIQLEGNQLEWIDENTFRDQRNLKRLLLNDNKLSQLLPATFAGLDRLEWLLLKDNQLTIEFTVFQSLSSLWWLDLSHNRLTVRAGNVFPRSETLRDLFLGHNLIQNVYNDTVADLPNLILLELTQNEIRNVDKDAFVRLTELKFLDLSYNLIELLPEGLFRSQYNLTQLRLGFNPILHLSAELFHPLTNLRSLSLHEIEIENITSAMFSHSTQLSFVYFKNFRYCYYVTHATKCKPLSDGVSSFTDLISYRIHRVFIWIVAVLTIVGNALVLGGRGLAKTENRILAMFVKNLAASDMCIGIYLLCIGERDIRFRGQYNQHAHQWMTSWECMAIRLLAVSTSEVSLLLLTFMSIERFVCISHPFGERTLNFRTALVSTAMIWLAGIGLALVPVLYWNEMGLHHGSNGLCFPLHIHEPFALGWQYSAFLYIGINGSCVMVIVGVYTALFLSIRRTRHATPLAPNEIEIAVRFFFIVFTDCLCWMPTILLKIMSLFNVYVPADLYAWLVVFILPVNSAINPFLYTFTTPTFRSSLRDLCRRVSLLDWASTATTSMALTSRSGVRSSVSLRHHDYHSSSSLHPNQPLAADCDDAGRAQIELVLLAGDDPFQPDEPLTSTVAAKWRGAGSRLVVSQPQQQLQLTLGETI